MDEELVEKSEILKKLLEDSSNAPYPFTDERFLTAFLRYKKLDVTQAFDAIKKYYCFLAKYPRMFGKDMPLSLQDFERIWKQQIFTVLPVKDEYQRSVVTIRMNNWDPSIVLSEDTDSYIFTLSSMMPLESETQVNGFITIIDFKGFSFYQLRHMSITMKRALIQSLQGTLPMRYKEFHILNEGMVFKLLYTLMSPILTKKLKSRIHFHGDSYESLHSKVNSNILPDWLGGPNQTSLEEDGYLQFLKTNWDYYKSIRTFNLFKEQQ